MSNRADGSFRSRDHEFPRIKGSSFRLGRPDDFPSKLGSTSRNTVVFFFYWNVGISTSSGSLSTTTLVFVRSHDRIRTFFSLFFSRRNRGSDALSEIFTLGTGRTFLFFLFFSFFFHGDRFFSGIFCNPAEILVYRNERTIGEFFFLFFGNLRVSTFAGQQREVWKKRAFSRCKFSRVVIHYDRIGFESGIFAETRTNAGKLRFVRSFSFFSFSLLFFFLSTSCVYKTTHVCFSKRGFDDVQSRVANPLCIYIVLYILIARSFEFLSARLFFGGFRRKRVGTILSFRISMAPLANRKIQTVFPSPEFPIRTFRSDFRASFVRCFSLDTVETSLYTRFVECVALSKKDPTIYS